MIILPFYAYRVFRLAKLAIITLQRPVLHVFRLTLYMGPFANRPVPPSIMSMEHYAVHVSLLAKHARVFKFVILASKIIVSSHLTTHV
jgi:hypothetical protein